MFIVECLKECGVRGCECGKSRLDEINIDKSKKSEKSKGDISVGINGSLYLAGSRRV